MASLATLLAALAMLFGLGLWRLMQGPIDLGALTPYIERLVDRSGGGLQIAISRARLAIDRQSRQLDLRLEGVRVADSDEEPLAAFPDIAASFSLGALLHGKLAPTRIVLEHPVLRLVRDETGALRFRLGEPDGGAPSFGPDILDQLAGPANPDLPFGLMRRVALRDATIIYDDRQTNRRWEADRVDAWIGRGPQGLAGDMSLALPLGDHQPELRAAYRYTPGERALDVSVQVEALQPAALASLFPELAPLSLADFPVSGTLATRVKLEGPTTEGLRLDLYLGKGSLRSELLPEGFIALQQGTIRFVYAPENGELRLAKLDLDLGSGSALTVKGNIDGLTPSMLAGTEPLPSSLPGRLGVVLTDVPVAKFESLWPPTLSHGGRRWVLANVHDGVLDEASAQLDLAIDPRARSAEVVSANGTMRYRDATISYFGGLTPARKVSGTATLDNRRLVFTPTSGSVKSVQATGGSLVITDLGAPVEWLAVDLSLAGPIRDVLETIDAKPLRYAHEIGVDPAHVAGRTEASLHFKLPLLKDLKLAEVQYAVKASLTGAAIAGVAIDRNLTDGNFALEITRPGAHLWGTSRFDGVPLDIDANLFFKPVDGARARYHVALTVDEEQRRRLAFNVLPDRVAGPVGVDLTYWTFDPAHAEAEAALDLRSASLAVAEAGWKKSPGAPAGAKLVLDLYNERVTRVRDIEVKAAGLDGRFAVELEPNTGRINRVDVHRLAIADDDVGGSVTRRREGGWQVDLHGRTLDLSNWLKDPGKKSSGTDAPLHVNARLGRLVVGPQREMRDVAAQLSREGMEWRAAQLDARFPNGHQLSLHSAAQAGGRSLTFRSDDLGSTLSLLDITNNIVGGQVTVTGQTVDKGGKQVVVGHVEGTDYNLVHAPPMARILSLPSFSGAGSMLAGSGIPFTTLRGDFAYGDDRLVLDKLLAYGGAIGVTSNGVVDLGRDQLDLQGTIVPAYALNSIIGNIPVIGSLLLGGEGQGLFAANYRVTGSAADPQVSVNPLSALAPGFLRRLFQPNFGIPPPVQQSLGAQ
ncbi:MAG: AsmA-like C-terminal domain-containing protein [Alphaproteobacteria bacterium]|nr:AsmA-like C-terminal domain-containing protein [Alphaproteobacteria bacterium]